MMVLINGSLHTKPAQYTYMVLLASRGKGDTELVSTMCKVYQSNYQRQFKLA